MHTKVGTAIRAASHDMEMVSVLGVNLDVLVAVLFLIAGGLGGMAGVFMGVKYMVYPSMGWITNKAYIGAVIGGLGSLPGAIVGGILLGLLEALVSVTTIGSVHLSTYRDVFSFGILAILLIVRPTGLFGRDRRREALGGRHGIRASDLHQFGDLHHRGDGPGHLHRLHRACSASAMRRSWPWAPTRRRSSPISTTGRCCRPCWSA